ncbi:MAG: biopolymer transporter ExbD [Fibrobacterota bacterium]
MANKIKTNEIKVEDIDFKPFMNLMVVLIPLLLASAQFAKIATIDINLPENRGSSTDVQDKKKDLKDKQEEKMVFTALLTDTAMTLMTKNAMLASIHYNEKHVYVSGATNNKDTLPYKHSVMYDDSGNYLFEKEYPDSLMRSEAGQFTTRERQEILLGAMEINQEDFEKTGKAWTGWYRFDVDTASGLRMIEYVTKSFDGDRPFFPLEEDELKVGDKVYLFTTRMSPYTRTDSVVYKVVNDEKEPQDTIKARRVIKVADMDKYRRMPVSAYDILKHAFIEVRTRNKEAKDRNSLIIASEQQVFYDKVVQIMDVARKSGLVNLSLNGLRAN